MSLEMRMREALHELEAAKREAERLRQMRRLAKAHLPTTATLDHAYAEAADHAEELGQAWEAMVCEWQAGEIAKEKVTVSLTIPLTESVY